MKKKNQAAKERAETASIIKNSIVKKKDPKPVAAKSEKKPEKPTKVEKKPQPVNSKVEHDKIKSENESRKAHEMKTGLQHGGSKKIVMVSPPSGPAPRPVEKPQEVHIVHHHVYDGP
jgi:hypothetical protein|mmetsp:Transcript_21353/g.28619  ORF Transcript_21353/g.28619 Transcript_21353/m.28619 type:complete len:117 (-) Transcript_21353:436-786(-)